MNVVINTGAEVSSSATSSCGANKTLRKTLHAIELSSGNAGSQNVMRHPRFIGSITTIAEESIIGTVALSLVGIN